jgi:hypothetical protein
VKELVRYLLDNIQLDFQGGIDLDTMREFLRKDDSHDARILLRKLNEDGSVEDLLLTLADVLKPQITRGITDQVMRDEMIQYAES